MKPQLETIYLIARRAENGKEWYWGPLGWASDVIYVNPERDAPRAESLLQQARNNDPTAYIVAFERRKEQDV